jgi:hypothetical protein
LEVNNIQEVANALVGDLADVMFSLGSELETSLKDYDTADVVEATRAFVHLRRVKDEIDELNKRFNKVYEEWKTKKIPQKFDEAGVPTVNLEEGYRVTISQLVRASVKPDQKLAAYDWLRNNGLGDIVTETINSSTLSAVAKSMAEENRELSADLFNVVVIPSTSVTRTGK